MGATHNAGAHMPSSNKHTQWGARKQREREGHREFLEREREGHRELPAQTQSGASHENAEQWHINGSSVRGGAGRYISCPLCCVCGGGGGRRMVAGVHAYLT